MGRDNDLSGKVFAISGGASGKSIRHYNFNKNKNAIHRV
jgi:hypothetical protein